MGYFFSIFMALKYFLAKKNEKFLSIISFIALVGNALGVAALIIVTSVMNGFHLALIANVIGISGEIKLASQEYDAYRVESLQRELLDYPFVISSDPVIYEKVLLLGQKITTGAIIRSFNLDKFTLKDKIIDNIVSGDSRNFELENVVFLGKPLADQLGLKVGNNIRVIASKYKPSLFGSLPKVKNFIIGAIYQTDFYDLDSLSILVSPQNIRNFLNLSEDYFNNIEVRISDVDKTDDCFYVIKSLIQQQDYNIYISTWKDHNKQLIESLKLEKISMIVILSVIVIVAAFNVLSGLFIFVKDKIKDISVLKKIGASDSQIMLIFLINGCVISLLSIVCGLIFGLFITYNINYIVDFLSQVLHIKILDSSIYFLTQVPYCIKLIDIVIIVVASFFLSVLASIYPSLRAAKVNPINLARYE